MAIFTLLVLAPLSSLMAPMVNQLEEPWLTVAIVLTAVVVYFVIDRLPGSSCVRCAGATDRGADVSPVQRPSRDQVLVFPTREDLRSWFEANHETASEAFIGYYRKGVGKPSTTWEEAVEEALCFGWIDGITFRIDHEVTANRFTPRRRTSSWSAVNIAKVAELRAAARMHPAGIRAFEERDPRKDQVYSYERPAADLPADWLARFQADADAWAYWQRQSPSYRRTAIHWVMSAVRPETRQRRFATLLADSAAGRRPRPFQVSSAPTP